MSDAEREFLVDAYTELQKAGLLRGSKLNDKVELSGNAVRMATRVGGIHATRVTIALQSMGSFDRLHIDVDRNTDQVIIVCDSERWRLQRIAQNLGELATQETHEAIMAAGGHEAVASKLLEMGRAR
jgi:hypothetical protein